MSREKQRARLIEILSRPIFPKIGVDPAEVVADYLLDNGVIVPPCKVGDTVYCVENKSIHEGIVEYVKSLTYGNVTKFFVRVECEIEDPFYNDGRKMKHGIVAVWGIEWGSWHMAFPTIEEAEKALEERSNHETIDP